MGNFYNNLSIRAKTIVSITVSFLISLLIVSFLLNYILANQFKDFEESRIAISQNSVLEALKYEIDNIDTTATDWAQWTAMHEFASGVYPEFVDRNLSPAPNSALQVNHLLIYNNKAEKIFESNLDYKTDSPIEVVKEIKDDLDGNKFLLAHSTRDSVKKGIIGRQGSKFLIVSRPILLSGGESDIAGTLILTRTLDREFKSKLERLTTSGVDLYGADTSELSKIAKENKNEIVNGGLVYSLFEGERSSVYQIYRDVFENPTFILKVSIDRGLFMQGELTLWNAMLALVSVSIANSIVFLYFINTQVFSRLRKLTRYMEHVSDPNVALQQIVTNQDELGKFNSQLNSMIKQIRENEVSLASKNVKLQNEFAHLTEEKEKLNNEKTLLSNQNSDLTRLNETLVDREVRMVEMKEEIAKLKGQLESKK